MRIPSNTAHLALLVVALGFMQSRPTLAQEEQEKVLEVKTKPEAVKTPAAPRQRVVYAVRHMPATDLAKAMTVFFQDVPRGELSVSPEPISNQLLISGQEKTVEEVLKFLHHLDQQPKVVAIDVWIVEIKAPADAATLSFSGPTDKIVPKLEELQKAGKLVIANHIKLGGAGNQPMLVQQGERRPFVRGSQTTASGRQSLMSLESMGTSVEATARVTPEDEIVMEINVEKSYPAPLEEGPVIAGASVPGGAAGGRGAEEVRAQGSLTVVCKTTVSIQDGHAITLSGISRSSPSPEVRIIAAARIVDDEGK